MVDDIYVYLVDLPLTVPEMVAPCSGGYTIYLNARLAYTDRVKAYLHALEHVARHDWEKEDVQDIELDAHK